MGLSVKMAAPMKPIFCAINLFSFRMVFFGLYSHGIMWQNVYYTLRTPQKLFDHRGPLTKMPFVWYQSIRTLIIYDIHVQNRRSMGLGCPKLGAAGTDVARDL